MLISLICTVGYQVPNLYILVASAGAELRILPII